MDEYVQYHNPEYADFPIERPGPFAVYTDKAVDSLLGARVWLVARRRKTREYYLVYWFIVESVVDDVEGRKGAWLRPAARLDQLPWFKDFLKYMGNFGLGLQKVADPRFVHGLRSVGGLAEDQLLAGDHSMDEIEQLERRIENLAPQEFAKFRAWFVEFDARAWDERIATDAKTGKLDGLIAEALADYKAGKAREL